MPQNILLAPGVKQEERPIIEEEVPVNVRAPAWRFHRDFPDRLCKTDAELDQLDAEGWVDKPGKARRLPGHEKMFDQYNAVKEEKFPEIVEPREKTEDEIKAEILKAESDKVEANRLEAERKAEEKRLKEEQKAKEKSLEPEQKSEETIAKEYEEAKSPPGPRLCTLCGMTFDSLTGLNRHLKRMHRRKGVKGNNL